MANTVDKVIAIAEAEVGYLEKSSEDYKANPSVIYDKTKGAGSDNYTKYNFEMHKLYSSVMDFPAAWCAAFVCWCFYKAYGEKASKEMLGGWDDYTKGAITKFRAINTFFTRGKKTPVKGDVVYFTKDGTYNGVHHTALVYKVDNNYIYTIEGNTSEGSQVIPNGGAVCKKQYPINDTRIYGYGRPKYDGASSEISITEDIAVKTYSTGLKIVGTNALNVRKSPVDGEIVGTYILNQSVIVTNQVKCSDDSYWFKSQKGYISGKYVEGWLYDTTQKKWWYVKKGCTYDKSCIKTIDNKDYIFDKSGWLVTADRISKDGNIVY